MLNKSNRKPIKRSIIILSGIIFVVLILCFIFHRIVSIHPPEITNKNPDHLKRVQLADNHYVVESNWLRKSESGLWEMYVSGGPFEMGIKSGKLSRELVYYQEQVFVTQIKELIPSKFYLRFLKHFISWFNKDLDSYIPLENQMEIYGVSLSADPQFDYIGNNYNRILNYHAAHDIGHAMQNLNLVACTSFGLWNEHTSDSSLLIGRNFDFYVGDDFAENKIVAFYKPEIGYRFAMVTWGGMTGVVSGMNVEGLTITLNAAKSEIPFGARTPVSIVARHILQYASNIEEAYEIAQRYHTFVTETFLIGSASDGNAALIEKTPDTTVLFESAKDYIIATNHLQHNVFSDHELNKENMAEGTSVYRFKRVEELVQEVKGFDYHNIAAVLRDQKGLKSRNIGMGNEKAINQLIAHHAVIFKPEEKLMWISTSPYQVGKFVCYDLNEVFSRADSIGDNLEIYNDSLEIEADTFLYSPNYSSYRYYKDFTKKYHNDLSSATENEVERFIKSNPEFYFTYEVAGDYYRQADDIDKTIDFYNFALEKEISSESERNRILKKLEELNGNTGY